MKAQFVILSGSSNRKLALTTAGLLGVEIGKCSLARFPDTEVNVQLNEPVRGRCSSFNLQVLRLTSTSWKFSRSQTPVVALGRRESAGSRPILVMRAATNGGTRRNAIMARLIADFTQRAGIDQLITVDLHHPKWKGSFKSRRKT